MGVILVGSAIICSKSFVYDLQLLLVLCKQQMLKPPKILISQSDLKCVKISSKLFKKSLYFGGLYTVPIVIGFVVGSNNSSKMIPSLSV